MIRVLHLIASPQGIGGAESVLLTLLREINSCKYQIMVGVFTDTGRGDDEIWRELEKAGAQKERVRLKSAYDIRQLGDLFNIMRKYRPHLIHTHGIKTNLLGLLFGKIFRIPVLTTVHGIYSSRPMRTGLYRSRFIILKRYDRIIAVSGEVCQTLQENEIDEQRIVTIRNVPYIRSNTPTRDSVSFREEMGVSARARMIGFVGRLEPVKGCHILVQAARRVLRKSPDSVFVIVGEGRERAALENEVRQQGLEENVIFCGFREDIHDVFSTMDLFVLPSLNEGIPLIMLEAMYFGVPVLATSVGGVPEVIEHGLNGILIPADDADALASGICALLDNREEAERMAKEAKNTMLRDYTLEKWIGQVEDLYHDLVTGTPS